MDPKVLYKIHIHIFDPISTRDKNHLTYNHSQNIWDKLDVQVLFFRSFLLVPTKFSFREEDQTLGNNSLKFWDCPDIS